MLACLLGGRRCDLPRFGAHCCFFSRLAFHGPRRRRLAPRGLQHAISIVGDGLRWLLSRRARPELLPSSKRTHHLTESAATPIISILCKPFRTLQFSLLVCSHVSHLRLLPQQNRLSLAISNWPGHCVFSLVPVWLWKPLCLTPEPSRVLSSTCRCSTTTGYENRTRPKPKILLICRYVPACTE